METDEQTPQIRKISSWWSEHQPLSCQPLPEPAGPWDPIHGHHVHPHPWTDRPVSPPTHRFKRHWVVPAVGVLVRLGGRNTEEARRDPITTAQGVPRSDTTVVITLAISATKPTAVQHPGRSCWFVVSFTPGPLCSGTTTPLALSTGNTMKRT